MRSQGLTSTAFDVKVNLDGISRFKAAFNGKQIASPRKESKSASKSDIQADGLPGKE